MNLLKSVLHRMLLVSAIIRKNAQKICIGIGFIVAFGIIVSVAILIIRLIIWKDWLPSRVNISFDFLTATTVFLSFIVALFVYTNDRKSQKLTLSEDKRSEFINSESTSKMRMLIENNDIELQTAVIIINILSDYHYDSDILPKRYQEMIQSLDQYLDFFEGMAILFNHGNIYSESTEGLWTYYSTRLMDVNTLDIGKTLDADKNVIKKEQILECMRKIYGGEVPKWASNSFDTVRQNPDKFRISDPVSRTDKLGEKWHYDNCKKDKGKECDSKTHSYIDPIERPIWYYINVDEYSWEHLTIMVRKLYEEKQRRKKRSGSNY